MQNNTCVHNNFTFPTPRNLPIPNNVSFNPYTIHVSDILSSLTSRNSCSTTTGASNVSRLYKVMENETTHINSYVNPMASQPSTSDSLIFMDYLGGTLEVDGETCSEGPNDGGCD